MARALFERCIASYIAHRISGALQRHRITDAGMRLDRAGGGAASGEGERLPGRLSLHPFFHERKIWIEDPFNRNSESCRRKTVAREKKSDKRKRTERMAASQISFTINQHYPRASAFNIRFL